MSGIENISGIEEIWEKANVQIEGDRSFDSEAMIKSISEGSKSITAALKKPLWLGIGFLVLSNLALCWNLFFYKGNLPVLTAVLVLLFISGFVIVSLFWHIRQLKGMDQSDMNLRDLLVSKIKYLNTRFNRAIHYVSFSIVLATFTINLSMENSDGIFEARKVLILSAFYLFVWIFTYALTKLSFRTVDRQLKNSLCNLEEQILRSMDSELKKHRKLMRFTAAILILICLAGIILLLMTSL